MVVFLFLPLFFIALVKKLFSCRKTKSIENRHVVITGGSSGIGKSCAILAARRGAHVTILARNVERLSAAKEEIQKECINQLQKVTAISVDVSKLEAVKKELDAIDENVAPIYMLINCAGMAICGTCEDVNEEDVKTLIDVNFLGTLYPIQSIIPKFKARKDGIIVLTASSVGLMGLYGYSVYSSCKFALRGLAESISMELKPYSVSVTLALPPDTDTPGFELENQTKPEETKLISEAAGLVQPEVVAEQILKDALVGNFFSYVGFESYILTNLCVGMSPYASFLEIMIQTAILGPLRLLSAYYINSFEKIVQRCYLAKQKNQ